MKEQKWLNKTKARLAGGRQEASYKLILKKHVEINLPDLIRNVTDLVGNGLELPEADFSGLARLPLLQQLPDTGDHVQAGLEGKADLLANELVRLTKDVAALGVAEDDPLAAAVQDHGRRQLALNM